MGELIDTIVTSRLAKAVDFIEHQNGVERAGKLLDLAARAYCKFERKVQEAETAWSEYHQRKHSHQAQIAFAAHKRLMKAYKAQLFKLFTK